jgi:alanyl-tRNA synthetase
LRLIKLFRNILPNPKYFRRIGIMDKPVDEEFDTKIEEAKTVKALTTKEIKALARPEFEQFPEKFYPTKVFEKIGFKRNRCKCGHYYWRHSEKQDTCGDSNCVGSYKFIGVGTGIGKKGKKITYAEAWKVFEKSLSTARVPCQAIDRYPVVARWRNDVDYVAAGIYCFQPYCVTGELNPPANPLICPQFCVRFNDLDNIGLTGRHYSGFVMIGIQVFNYPDKYVFFKEECVEFNYRWLTEELEIEPDEITFIEDVWAGGGNLGPSIEYFVNGLEVGNMVFMQYKTFHDGSREELPIKIIDTGIGLERIPWLINGSATSYVDTFKFALEFLTQKLEVSVNNEIWEKFGPYSCLLNVDEVDDVDKTWKLISEKINVEVDALKKAILIAKEIYVVLDHTRSIFMIISDGSLPSNVGGGANVRNILRRVFALLKKNGWMEKLKMDGLVQLFESHKKDLETLYGKFPEYKSFRSIIEMEYERWLTTDTVQKTKLDKLLKKNNKLTMDDWILAMTAWGIPADAISQISGQEPPGTLYYEIAQREERVTKAVEAVLYSTTHLQETEQLFYQPNFEFEATILDIFKNVSQGGQRNIVILDRSAFYPTSGGQAHDVGELKIDGQVYYISNAEKVGKSVLHILDKPLPNPENSHYIGKSITGKVNEDRRKQLRNHHTATHIVFASCRKVLGPHIWQNGAKKTVDQAHLDVTHFTSITREEELAIENEANRIILKGKKVKKFFMNKSEAELEYGFRLYQGGIVPGNQLRVVQIEDTDVEACCGTHCDNTSEVGWIKILKTTRIQDGIVRLYFVAGEKTIERLNKETAILNELQKIWSIPQTQIVETGERFFKDYKKLNVETDKQAQKILELQMRYVIDNPNHILAYIHSDHEVATIFFSFLGQYAQELKAAKKGVVFIGKTFIFGLLGAKDLIKTEKLKELLAKKNEKADIKTKNEIVFTKPESKDKIKTSDILQFSYIGLMDAPAVQEFFQGNAFKEAKV